MLDFPAFGQALWSLYDATGIRPEYAIVSMRLESGLNPAAENSAGYTGLNQMGPGRFPDGYASWPASQQVSQVIAPFWKGLVDAYGPIKSGTRLEQGNMYPASLKYARGLGDVIVSTSNDPAAYEGNRGAFDPKGTGAITVRGIARALDALVDGSSVQTAIQATYSLRPGESPKNPVYGTEFVLARFGWVALGGAALGAGLSVYLDPAWPLRAWRNAQRYL